MEGLRSDPFTEAFSPRMAFRHPFKDWIAVGIYFGAISSLSASLLRKTATRFCIFCIFCVCFCFDFQLWKDGRVEMLSGFIDTIS